MLNHSVSHLRQIRLSNISVARSKSIRSVSGASQRTYEGRIDHAVEAAGYKTGIRPSPLRRRSTRTRTYGEPSASRLQRFEAAIEKHTYETFIVLYEGREVIYISERQCGISPVFLPLDIANRAQTIEVAAYTRLPGKPWQLSTRLTTSLPHLTPSKGSFKKRSQNEIEFQFDDEIWYGAQMISDDDARVPKAILESYSFNQIMRLQSSAEVINDALQSIVDLKDNLTNLLHEADERLERCRELELCRLATQEVSDSTRLITKSISIERLRATKLRETIKLRKSLLSSGKAHMTSVMADLQVSKEKSLTRQPALALLSTEIRRLQRELTTTLSEIYPIVISSHETRIRGLKPARNSDYWMHNPEESAALGYMAHFIFLLSHYLGIPLRYPVRPVSSHSSILDPISIMPDSSDVQGGPPFSIKKERRFPLYYERGGVERLQWAAFLLNKNIEQLLQGRGLVCGDLRDSLHNLGGLVVWLVSVNEEEDTSLTRPRRQVQPRRDAQDSHQVDEDDNHGIQEITDHEDLLAAQLRSRIKGKRRMTLVSEKDEEIAGINRALDHITVS